MKKVFGLACLGFIFLGICGCGKVTQDPHAITVWHWMSDRHATFVQLAEKYHQETGVTVNFQLFAPSDIYSQKITAAAQAQILPDIFGVLDKKSVLGEFIKNGFVANLKNEFDRDHQEWQGRFFDKALAGNIFEEGNLFGIEPGIYGVPLDVTTIQMVYNKKILRQAGFENPPKTFDEFVTMSHKLRGLGFTPFVSGWNELWMLECFSSNYAFNIMGEDKVMATYRGEVPYTDPDWIQVFTIFQIMAQQGMISDGVVMKTNKFAEQDFALERAAFAFNGSWGVNVYNGMNADLEYGVMMLPVFSDAYPLMIWGGAGSSLMVNAASPHKEKAVAFLKWLTATDQQRFLAEQTKNLPANRHALASLPEQLVDFGHALEFSTHPTVWAEEEDVIVRERFNKGLQLILIGEKTPEDVAKEVQAIKERQMQRAGR